MNPNILRALMGNSLLPPPVDVGVILTGMTFNDANTALGLQSDLTFDFDARTEEAVYRYYWVMTASPAYDFVFPIPSLYKNGALAYRGHVGSYPGLGWSIDSWFFGNTGSKGGSFDFTAKGGDEINMQYSVGTRIGGPGNHTYIHHKITRLS